MFKFKRDGKDLELWFGHNIVQAGHVFVGNCETESIAQILSDRFNHELEKKLSHIKEQAYLEGYKSGKNHDKKKTKFMGTFDTQIW